MSRRLEQQAAPAGTGVSHVYPIGSRLDERGRLEVGGCDVFDLAAEFGTPAYVYAVEDIRTRARAYVDGFRKRTDHFEVVYASKAFPCTAAYRLLAEEGIACDVASGGELYLALRGGFAPEKIYFHGNNKSRAEIAYAQEAGVGHVVIDSFHEIDLIEAPQRVMLRVTPGIKPTTHDYIATGQVDSKFGFGLDDVPRAIEAVGRRGLELVGLHAHLGSQIFDLGPFEKLAEVLTQMGDYPLLNLGGGLGIAYTAGRDAAADRRVRRDARGRRSRRCHRPVRAGTVAGRQRRGDDLHGRHRQGDPRRPHLRRGRRRHVRQPAPDALRRALRGRDRRPLRRRDRLHDRGQALRVGRRAPARHRAERRRAQATCW